MWQLPVGAGFIWLVDALAGPDVSSDILDYFFLNEYHISRDVRMRR